MLTIDPCSACKYCRYDPQSGWCACEKKGGLTPHKRCDDFEQDTIAPTFQTEMLSATTDLEDLEPGEYKPTGEYKPINEDTILTPEQMAVYHIGYVDGIKWLINYLIEGTRKHE